MNNSYLNIVVGRFTLFKRFTIVTEGSTTRLFRDHLSLYRHTITISGGTKRQLSSRPYLYGKDKYLSLRLTAFDRHTILYFLLFNLLLNSYDPHVGNCACQNGSQNNGRREVYFRNSIRNSRDRNNNFYSLHRDSGYRIRRSSSHPGSRRESLRHLSSVIPYMSPNGNCLNNNKARPHPGRIYFRNSNVGRSKDHNSNCHFTMLHHRISGHGRQLSRRQHESNRHDLRQRRFFSRFGT